MQRRLTQAIDTQDWHTYNKIIARMTSKEFFEYIRACPCRPQNEVYQHCKRKLTVEEIWGFLQNMADIHRFFWELRMKGIQHLVMPIPQSFQDRLDEWTCYMMDLLRPT